MTGDAFRKIRLEHLKMTQYQLAEALGWRYYEIVSRTEGRGPKVIPPKRAQALLDYLGLQACPTCGQPMRTDG